MKLFCSVFIILLSFTNLVAQDEGVGKLTEVGLSLNFLHYSGDLSESRIVFKDGEFGFGIHIRRALNNHISLVGKGVIGRISGDDANNGPDLRDRKYRFYSPITEVGLLAEIYPSAQHFQIGTTGSSWRPFLFVGGAVAYIDPRTEFYGVGTNPFPEPDLTKKVYSLPFGFGLRAEVYDRVGVTASLGWRPTASDKIDGVSINGNSKIPDWYSIMHLGFSYMLTGHK